MRKLLLFLLPWVASAGALFNNGGPGNSGLPTVSYGATPFLLTENSVVDSVTVWVLQDHSVSEQFNLYLAVAKDKNGSPDFNQGLVTAGTYGWNVFTWVLVQAGWQGNMDLYQSVIPLPNPQKLAPGTYWFAFSTTYSSAQEWLNSGVNCVASVCGNGLPAAVITAGKGGVTPLTDRQLSLVVNGTVAVPEPSMAVAAALVLLGICVKVRA